MLVFILSFNVAKSLASPENTNNDKPTVHGEDVSTTSLCICTLSNSINGGGSNAISKTFNFKINNNLLPYLDNILASIAVCKSLNIIDKIKSNFFSNYKIPSGRGNIKKFTVGSKKVNIIDESYNSNPLSLNFSIKKFDNLKVNPNKKFMLLGDMLELGKFSRKLHIEAAKDINKVKFKKLFVYGNYITETFNKIRTQKRGKILKSSNEILNIIKNELKNGDFLMIKGSNSTGLNQIIKQLGSKS